MADSGLYPTAKDLGQVPEGPRTSTSYFSSTHASKPRHTVHSNRKSVAHFVDQTIKESGEESDFAFEEPPEFRLVVSGPQEIGDDELAKAAAEKRRKRGERRERQHDIVRQKKGVQDIVEVDDGTVTSRVRRMFKSDGEMVDQTAGAKLNPQMTGVAGKTRDSMFKHDERRAQALARSVGKQDKTAAEVNGKARGSAQSVTESGRRITDIIRDRMKALHGVSRPRLHPADAPAKLSKRSSKKSSKKQGNYSSQRGSTQANGQGLETGVNSQTVSEGFRTGNSSSIPDEPSHPNNGRHTYVSRQSRWTERSYEQPWERRDRGMYVPDHEGMWFEEDEDWPLRSSNWHHYYWGSGKPAVWCCGMSKRKCLKVFAILLALFVLWVLYKAGARDDAEKYEQSTVGRVARFLDSQRTTTTYRFGNYDSYNRRKTAYEHKTLDRLQRLGQEGSREHRSADASIWYDEKTAHRDKNVKFFDHPCAWCFHNLTPNSCDDGGWCLGAVVGGAAACLTCTGVCTCCSQMCCGPVCCCIPGVGCFNFCCPCGCGCVDPLQVAGRH